MNLGLGLSIRSQLQVGGPPLLDRTGLISEYLFNEGAGTTVTDRQGSNTINLTTPTNPNYTWTTRGISLAAGLVQTPLINGIRTRVLLYKMNRNENAGFTLSGGSGGASGAGIIGHQVPTAGAYTVGLNGVRPLAYRPTFGDGAWPLNRGGWVLVFEEFPAAYNTITGIGGRHSTTTSRCTNFEMAGCWLFSSQMDATQKASLYAYARYIARSRGFYIDYRDCSVTANCVLLWGQSNAAGYGDQADLSTAQKARTFSHTYLEVGDLGTRPVPPPALMVRGATTITAPATNFGPELSFGWKYEDDYASRNRDLYISKMGAGSTYLAPSGVGSSTVPFTWDTDLQLESQSGLLYAKALLDWNDMESALLQNGIGPDLKALLWMQGEQDATSTTYSTLYEAQLGKLYTAAKLYTGRSTLPIILGRIRNIDPAMDATAAAQVRAAQAAFVAANPGTTLIDTDTFPVGSDSVHYTATGQIALGEAFYNAVTWS